MGFSYGKIIVEICKVVKQRYHLTQSSATERKTSEVQTQQQIEMTPFQKVSEGAEVPALAQSQGNITEEHEIKTEKEEPINQPKMDNDTKQVNLCLNFLGVETILTQNYVLKVPAGLLCRLQTINYVGSDENFACTHSFTFRRSFWSFSFPALPSIKVDLSNL